MLPWLEVMGRKGFELAIDDIFIGLEIFARDARALELCQKRFLLKDKTV